MKQRLLWLLVFAVSLPLAAQAQKLYKWVDKDGRVSYHDQPPPTDGYRVEEKTLRGGRVSIPANQAVAAKSPVVMYMTPRCTSCDAARAYLKKRGVPFSEKNVQNDRPLQEELMKQTGGELAVPTILVGKKVMRGFMESLLEGELDEAGYAKLEETPSEPSSEPTTAVAEPGDRNLAPTR
jgi:glutaredoxin